MVATAKAERSESTVANILAAAEDLFLARNYADVTVSEVAEAARVTKGAVYHHFDSKEELYLAMLHADLAEKRRLHQRGVELDATCRERLRVLTAAFLSLPEKKRKLIELVRRDVNVFPVPLRARLIQAYQDALPQLVETILRDGIRDGEVIPADPRLLAWQFVALVEVILTPYAKQRFATDEDKLNYVMSLFFDGCSRERQAPGEHA